MLAEFPGRGEQVAGLGPFQLRLLERERLAVVLCHPRLGIQQVQLRRTTGHVQEDATFPPGRMVRRRGGPPRGPPPPDPPPPPPPTPPTPPLPTPPPHSPP